MKIGKRDMEAGSEASPIAKDMVAEILKTKELIHKLREAERLARNQLKNAEELLRKTNAKIRQIKKHRLIKLVVGKLMKEMNYLEKFPDMLRPPSNLQNQCIWEKPISTLTSKLQHGNSNLVAERKKLREIQQLEKKREQCTHDECHEGSDNSKDKYYTRPYIYDLGRLVKAKHNEDIHSAALREWAARIKRLSELVIDNKKNAVCNCSYMELFKLENLRVALYIMVSEVNRAKLQHCWNLKMRDVQNMILHFRSLFSRLMKGAGEEEDNAELERLGEKVKAYSSSVRLISNKLQYEVKLPKRRAYRLLNQLQERLKIYQ